MKNRAFKYTHKACQNLPKSLGTSCSPAEAQHIFDCLAGEMQYLLFGKTISPNRGGKLLRVSAKGRQTYEKCSVAQNGWSGYLWVI